MSNGSKPRFRATYRTSSSGKPIFTYINPGPIAGPGTAMILHPSRHTGAAMMLHGGSSAYVNQFNFGHMSGGQRALHMGAYTEQYLPKGMRNFFGKTAFRQSAGKYLAEAFGWHIDPGGAGGQEWTKMGKSQGFLGSKVIAEKGSAAFRFGGGFYSRAFMGSVSLAFTLDYMKSGWDESGAIGAVGGAGEAIATQAIFRKAVPKVFGVNWSGAKKGWAGGRGLMTGYAAAGGFAGGAATAAGFGLGALGGAVVGAAASLVNPFMLAIAGGIYAYDQISEGIDIANRGNARLRQVSALEMGSPIVDQYGSISTLRQRSLAALQNSHVNGRMALGNEAALLH